MQGSETVLPLPNYRDTITKALEHSNWEHERGTTHAACQRSDGRHSPRTLLHSTRAITLLRSGRRGGAAVALGLSRTAGRWRGVRATRGREEGEAEAKGAYRREQAHARWKRWGATWAPDARCPRKRRGTLHATPSCLPRTLCTLISFWFSFASLIFWVESSLNHDSSLFFNL